MEKRGPKPRRREVIWSSNLAYGIGLMATDGTLSIDGRHLECTSKDKEQIQNVQKCFEITADIKMKSARRGEKKKYYRVQWGDTVLYKFFLSIGLTPNKSLTLGRVIIPDQYFFDFLRGCFDGDGCFYSYFDPRWKNSFMFYLTFTSGSPNHIKWLQNRIKILCAIKGHVTKNSKASHITNLKYAKHETLILLRLLYPQTSVLCLPRKRLKIQKALSIVNESL